MASTTVPPGSALKKRIANINEVGHHNATLALGRMLGDTLVTRMCRAALARPWHPTSSPDSTDSTPVAKGRFLYWARMMAEEVDLYYKGRGWMQSEDIVHPRSFPPEVETLMRKICLGIQDMTSDRVWEAILTAIDRFRDDEPPADVSGLYFGDPRHEWWRVVDEIPSDLQEDPGKEYPQIYLSNMFLCPYGFNLDAYSEVSKMSAYLRLALASPSTKFVKVKAAIHRIVYEQEPLPDTSAVARRRHEDEPQMDCDHLQNMQVYCNLVALSFAFQTTQAWGLKVRIVEDMRKEKAKGWGEPAGGPMETVGHGPLIHVPSQDERHFRIKELTGRIRQQEAVIASLYRLRALVEQHAAGPEAAPKIFS